MASSLLYNQTFHLQPDRIGLVNLMAKVKLTGDTTPADTVIVLSGNGFKSVERTAAGEFEVTLDKNWVKSHNVQATLVAASDLTTGQALKLLSDDVTTGKFKFALTDELGAPEDLTDAEVAEVNLHVIAGG